MPIDLNGYVDVAERIREFRAKHPEGSLQPLDVAEPFKVLLVEDQTFIVYTAAAYRTPDDQRPGVGIAWEPYPGRTSFTKDSEVMNAETSAWGRAIVAALAADSTKVASADEVRNRQADRDAPARPSGPRQATEKQRGMIERLVREKDYLPQLNGETVWPLPDNLSMRDASAIIDQLQAEDPGPKAERRRPSVESVAAELGAELV